MMTQEIALVSKADEIGPKELARAAAALNTQLRRDFGSRAGARSPGDAMLSI